MQIDHRFTTEDPNMFRIEGLNPMGENCEFSIKLNGEFGRKLEELEVPEKQENAHEFLEDMFDNGMMDDIRWRGDSFLIRNITVDFDATGLDLHKTRDEYVYHTHNVDNTHQAIQIIAIFSKWVEFGRTLLESE